MAEIATIRYHAVQLIFFLETIALTFVIIHLQTRRIVHAAVTRSPPDEWTAQQLREATPWGQDPKYLIRDRDDKYGPLFSDVANGTGINVLKTLVRAPKANVPKVRAVCEHFTGSLARECLDHKSTINPQTSSFV